MRWKIWAGLTVAFGTAMITGPLAEHAMDTLSQVPTSSYVAAGLIPAMLAGQLFTLRKRSRR